MAPREEKARITEDGETGHPDKVFTLGGLVDFGVEVALFGFEVSSHGHDVFDDAFELGFGHWGLLVVHDGFVEVVGEA